LLRCGDCPVGRRPELESNHQRCSRTHCVTQKDLVAQNENEFRMCGQVPRSNQSFPSGQSAHNLYHTIPRSRQLLSRRCAFPALILPENSPSGPPPGTQVHSRVAAMVVTLVMLAVFRCQWQQLAVVRSTSRVCSIDNVSMRIWPDSASEARGSSKSPLKGRALLNTSR
jgi:hypothetical protein